MMALCMTTERARLDAYCTIDETTAKVLDEIANALQTAVLVAARQRARLAEDAQEGITSIWVRWRSSIKR